MTTYIQVETTQEGDKYDGNFAKIQRFRNTFTNKLQARNRLALMIATGKIKVEEERTREGTIHRDKM